MEIIVEILGEKNQLCYVYKVETPTDVVVNVSYHIITRK